jgi:hypothetical protein
MEQVEFWTYNVKNGNAYIYFDKNTKCIEIPEKDLKTMMDWINMDKDTYVPKNYRKENNNE